ncbi:MAG: lysine exporter LysO family protein [Cellvibrionales bacterium]|nr:lysine exporter LysO family protein [Cellvibrionales bacterium]
MISLLIVFILGWLFTIQSDKWLTRLNQLLLQLVFLILVFLGANLASHPEIADKAEDILKLIGAFMVAIIVSNILALVALDVIFAEKDRLIENNEADIHEHFSGLLDTLKVILSLAIGAGIGTLFDLNDEWLKAGSSGLLHVLLFLVGVQLRSSRIPLSQFFLNPLGLLVTVAVIGSTLLAAAFIGWLMGMPILKALAVSSGFGWYSLSGVLIAEKFGPIYGTVAFCNDVLREVIAFILIPTIIKKYPLTAIGVGGATTIDFTLPMIQAQGGTRYVPIAIVSGFLLSVFVPVLIGLFSHF